MSHKHRLCGSIIFRGASLSRESRRCAVRADRHTPPQAHNSRRVRALNAIGMPAERIPSLAILWQLQLWTCKVAVMLKTTSASKSS